MKEMLKTTVLTHLYRTAAVIMIAAAVLFAPSEVRAETSDPEGITEILTSESEKDKLREALIELERQGLTPRVVWKKLRGQWESGDLPDPAGLVQDARDGAVELMEDASTEFEDVEQEVRENLLQQLLRMIGEKWEGWFGQ